MSDYPKKLIEVALPLAEINDASAYDKMPGVGAHPKGIHHWWARLPLPSARAILFASVVNDPSEEIEKLRQDPKAVKKAKGHLTTRRKAWGKKKVEYDKAVASGMNMPDLENEPSLDDILVENEREKLFGVIRELMQKKPHENKDTFRKARKLIEEACDGKIPEVLDPFTGGGSIPLEAHRLGFKAHGRDLNPVPALITKATIDYPARFHDQPAINPRDRDRQDWEGAQGLAEDVRYYGDWMLEKAKEQIGHLYPEADVTPAMVDERPDLAAYQGRKLPVIAWIWARTIPSPNPALNGKEVPLVSSYWLSSKKGKEAWIQPIIKDGDYEFTVRLGVPPDKNIVKSGTKSQGANFNCILSGVPIDARHIKKHLNQGDGGHRLLAIVCGLPNGRGRCYLPPTNEHSAVADANLPEWKPEQYLPKKALGFRVQPYGMKQWFHLFSVRQLVALNTFSTLVEEARQQALADGAEEEQANAIATYLAFAVDRLADFNNSLCRWASDNQKLMNLFGRQVIPMVWDFCEANLVNQVVGGWPTCFEYAAKCISIIPIVEAEPGDVKQQDAAATNWTSQSLIISTDPPYYDNISYADLSDFFYVWLRRSLREVHPDLLGTMLTPKAEELISSPERHEGDKIAAKDHFEGGFRKAFGGMREAMDRRFPLTVYYAMKQSGGDEGVNTGWETMLTGLIDSGFQITATWPVRAAQDWRMRSMGSNALANYVVLACRERLDDNQMATRREFIMALKAELPSALNDLQLSNIGAVDFFQAALGPGMAIFSRYTKVIEADGTAMTVGSALRCINEEVGVFLNKQTGEMDPWTRFAVAWFSEHGFTADEFGKAETLALSINVSVEGVAEAGIIQSGGGKVRILSLEELPEDWSPVDDNRLTVWEIVHHLARRLDKDGIDGAATILKQVGGLAEDARALCYRLYTICEQNKWADEGRTYNNLITEWSTLTDRVRTLETESTPTQQELI